MDVRLMELPTGELLQKFGAGNHKPGSGSAAAYLGLASAQLLRTVINLTDKPKHYNRYSEQLPELRRILAEIDNRILPTLEKLFQEDSEQFDKAIKARNERDKETDLTRRAFLIQQAVIELKPATQCPIEIAKLCIELADFAGYVFSYGFKSAKGDAGVAQNAAIAAVGGCLSIIHLNLLTFGSNSWTHAVRRETASLQDTYLRLSSEAINCIDVLRKESDVHDQCHSEINSLLASVPDESKLTDAAIEVVARELQLLLWKHKDAIWKYEEIVDPLEVLQPHTTLKTIGYQFYKAPFLESHEVDGESFDIAGLINKEQRFVQVSTDYAVETQNFTAAHELGHALFHKQAVLHRDRPLDGSNTGYVRDKTELQADKFAAYFLMPAKQVRNVFKSLFLMDKFVADENSVFALTNRPVATFRESFETTRDVSRFLGKPMATTFGVSVETMAIRLEELGLIDY